MTDLENKMKKAIDMTIDPVYSDLDDVFYELAGTQCAQIAQQHAEEMAIKFKDWCESDIAHHLENNRNYLTKELYQQFLKETGK